jgi:hypothetical protein
MSTPTASPIAALVVECFAPASDGPQAISAADCVAAACAGLKITYLGALIVPDDELAFHVFGASDVATVLEASNRAGLRVERIVRSVLLVAVESERTVAYATSEIGP